MPGRKKPCLYMVSDGVKVLAHFIGSYEAEQFEGLLDYMSERINEPILKSQISRKECEDDWQYTAARWCVSKDTYIGPIHAADRETDTRCGLKIESNWWILTNRKGEGTVTCKKCLQYKKDT